MRRSAQHLLGAVSASCRCHHQGPLPLLPASLLALDVAQFRGHAAAAASCSQPSAAAAARAWDGAALPWLLAATAAGAAATTTALADSPTSAAPGGPLGQPLTNHPLEYDPVTNEHTAKMTMARTAALDYYNAKKYAQAEAKFKEAVAEAQLGFEPSDPHIASAKNNLAEFYRNTGQWDKAEALYKEALDLLELNYGEKHWLFVSALHNLALSYEARGDLAAARATMERVLALRLAMFGPRHFLYADSLFALGHMLRKDAAAARRGREGGGRAAGGGRGRADGAAEGLRMMSEAVRVLEEAENVQVSVVLFWLTEVASALAADGRLPEAASALRRALAHMAADRGEATAYASAISEELVEALARAGRYGEAAREAAKALAARKEVFGPGQLVVAQSELKVAQLQLHARAQQGGRPTHGSVGAAGAEALQHAEEAARVAAACVEECTKGAFMAGPPADRLVKRLKSAHVLGGAAKLIASLAGVEDPSAPPLPAPAPAADPAGSQPSSSGSKKSWWPFGKGGGSKPAPAVSSSALPAAGAGEQPAAADGSAAQADGGGGGMSDVPIAALLVRSDQVLSQAAGALLAATQAGQELLKSVSSGRPLPPGVAADELAGALVEAEVQLLDVLDRLALVLEARMGAAGDGAAAQALGVGAGSSREQLEARRRGVLAESNRVAELLLGS